MKKILLHIFFPLLPLAALLCSSCERLPNSSGTGEGEETLVIRIGPAETRSAKDGDLMVNLRVWMVNGSGTVSRYASLTPNAAEATVTFDNVSRGDYTLYFLANSTALSSYTEGSTIDDNFLKSTLSLSGSATSPDYSVSEGMPLSLAKSISVGPGVNRVSAELVRVCGLVNITVKNRSADKTLYISSVSLSDRNPSSGYVFQQSDHSSPSGTAYGAFPSDIPLTKIDPYAESKVQTFYLFENCGSSEAIRFTLNGGLYAESSTVSLVDKIGYRATGSATNTTIDASKYYFLASASAQRFFLKADGSTLKLQEVGSDDELFVKRDAANNDDVTNYLWQFGSTGTSTSVQNVKVGTYLGITISRSGSSYSSSYSLSNTSSALSTRTSTGRQFYATSTRSGTTRYSYLYNNSGTIGVTSTSISTSSAENTGWYLREASEYTYQVLSPDPEKPIDITTPLTYTDSYGIAQPLTSICRNDRLEVVVNVFYNPLTGTFDFQVESWRTKDNQTTFD